VIGNPLAPGDDSHHTLNLRTLLSETHDIAAVVIVTEKNTGSDDFFVIYPNKDTSWPTYIYPQTVATIALSSNELEYWMPSYDDEFYVIVTGYWRVV
jgi:hypothetical protein